jgi:translation elongation factor EF-Tu-like GTPase
MKVKANVTFLPPNAGGHAKPVLPGIRPQFKVGDFFTSSVVLPLEDVKVFERNVPYQVVIELPLGSYYRGQISVGTAVQLNDGSRVIGTGVLEEVIEP